MSYVPPAGYTNLEYYTSTYNGATYYGWMPYATQAGVALGFAQEIKEEYRQTFSASVADPRLEA
jgi:hypothetical protein|tara:strand:+ start:130 stop:321 length:192 start_codon:yes stop_codon:yes gene_type:complete